MGKILNIIMLLSTILFIFFIYKYYSSEKIIYIKNFNRMNMEEIFKEKITNLPILYNDTDKVIEFNDSFEDQINDTKKRSFWDLLNNK